jgi:hypothetical protein
MSKVYDQLHEAAQSGRSDVIGRAVEDWLNGVSTSEELADVVSAETRPTVDDAVDDESCAPEPTLPSATQRVSASGGRSDVR